MTDAGFEYAGITYSSLTKIAQAITGAHWSGPRFFGLNRNDASDASSDPNLRDMIGEGECCDG